MEGIHEAKEWETEYFLKKKKDIGHCRVNFITLNLIISQ